MQAIDEPFFAQLRTKQQTGYIVASAGEEIEKELFDLFGVQSNSHDPRDLLARFELFIEGYLQELDKEIPPERLVASKLIIKLNTSAKNIKDMGELLNRIAFKYNADFNWMEKGSIALMHYNIQNFYPFQKSF